MAAAPLREQDRRVVVELPVVVVRDRRHQSPQRLVQRAPPGVMTTDEVDEPVPAELPPPPVTGLDDPIGIQQQPVTALQMLDTRGRLPASGVQDERRAPDDRGRAARGVVRRMRRSNCVMR